MTGLCAVVLAAGEGRRLRPLTALRPKPLCPVDNVALVDRVLHRLAAVGLAGPEAVAANACHGAEQLADHLAGRAYLSRERPPALGTAGGLARLRDWIAGRDVLVCNADGYLDDGVAAMWVLLRGWDRRRPRLLVVPDAERGDFAAPEEHTAEWPHDPDPGERPDGPGRPADRAAGRRRVLRFAGASLAPWSMVAALPTGPGELSTTAWRPAEAAGRLDLARFEGTFLDCGTPAEYLAANLHASGGTSVVGAGAAVAGRLTRSVVWPGATVAAGEHLVDAVRAVAADGGPVTVSAHTGRLG